LVAISRGGRSFLPKTGVVGQEGDVLHILVTEGALDELEEQLEKRPRS
jgi:Trk K+ transport system NAD-binding subunit